MKKINTLAALIIILNYSNNFAQGLDTTQWFPYKAGNMWEYYVVEDGVLKDTLQIINEKDSLLPDGTIYLTQRTRFINPTNEGLIENYLIDTSKQKVFGYNYFLDSLESYLLYDFNAKQGEQWIIYNYNLGGGFEFEIARVKNIFEDINFGHSSTHMEMNYYAAEDSTDTIGLDRYGAILAKGFGLTYKGGGDIFYDIVLKGCVINNTLYGDTTNIVLSVGRDNEHNLPDDITLNQNYPNPFNPGTFISFRNNAFTNITLIIYDVLGKEVRRILSNQNYHPGNHKVYWDGNDNNGKNAASGTYYFSLFNDEIRLTRSMILLK